MASILDSSKLIKDFLDTYWDQTNFPADIEYMDFYKQDLEMHDKNIIFRILPGKEDLTSLGSKVSHPSHQDAIVHVYCATKNPKLETEAEQWIYCYRIRSKLFYILDSITGLADYSGKTAGMVAAIPVPMKNFPYQLDIWIQVQGISSITTTTIMIAASADDAMFGVTDSLWLNAQADNIAGRAATDKDYNTYFRFAISFSAGITIHECLLYIYVSNVDNDPTVKLYLIDLDNCGAFPDGAGDETGYPVTSDTPIEYACPSGDGVWRSIDITSLLQAYLDRSGYAAGQYIGIKIFHNNQETDHEINTRTFDSGSNIPYLEIKT